MTMRTPAGDAPRTFECAYRVYYEDTDAGGIVYHANYLRWMERVRTEWLRALGVRHQEITQQDGVQFVVSEMDIRYLKPARLDDEVRVDLLVTQVRRASLWLTQRVWAMSPTGSPAPPVVAKARPLVEASVRVAIMSRHDGRPAALPQWLLNTLESE